MYIITVIIHPYINMHYLSIPNNSIFDPETGTFSEYTIANQEINALQMEHKIAIAVLDDFTHIANNAFLTMQIKELI